MKHYWLKFGFTIFLSYDILHGYDHQCTEIEIKPHIENYSHQFDDK